MTLHVIGVRHHSPACARRVQQVLDTVKPKWVLIEGPSQMNGRLGELALAHKPPIALFSFHFSEHRRYSAWHPYCVHSPEWVALRGGLELGAQVRFIDLPGWAIDDSPPENRYADRRGSPEYISKLEEATAEQGYDAVWDAIFELPAPEGLHIRLKTYFDGLRTVEPASDSDLQREAFMGDYVAWANAQDGDVLVVCGGFHAPVLEAVGDRLVDREPQAPKPSDAVRAETWLVPYSQARLDSFTGYASGLPSPAWYRWSWFGEDPGRQALQMTATRLRKKGVPISAADTLAAWTQAQTLARLRGHPSVGRVDLLDAVASTWVKEALEQPLPWSSRQVIQPGTHPVIVELVKALSGEVRGSLACDTPLPPLVQHIDVLLERLDLQPAKDRTLALYPGEIESKPRLVALERLLLMGIAGFSKVSGPELAPVRWSLMASDDFSSTVLEAASYGPTLQAAAIAVLEERATQAEGFAELVHLLVASVRADLPALSARAVSQLRKLTCEEPSFLILGEGLGRLVGLLRHAGLSAGDRSTTLELMEAAVDHGLWLAEGIHGGGTLCQTRIGAVEAIRDAVQQGADQIGIPASRIEGVWSRIAQSTDAPADLRGAALGALVSLDYLGPKEAAAAAQRSFETATAQTLGDYLAGLITLSREVLVADEGLGIGLDEALAGLDAPDFMVALPSLRVAFQRLPARERALFASRVAGRHGGLPTDLTARLKFKAEDIARARQLEQQVQVLLEEVGLDGTAI